MFSKVGLVCHSRRADAAEAAEKAAVFLRERGVSVFNPLSEESGEHPDLILTFGGDGTLLSGAGLAIRENCPLLGFNLGTVGFLTEEDPRGLEEALTALFEGRFRTEERSLLRVCNEKTEEEFFALNDAVVTRGGFARLIRVESHVNGELQDIYTADGLIVATPTGSTGYSLSAGGPIVEPSMNCMIITPVCAHSLHHCPTIISGKSVIRLRLREDRSQSAELQIDGRSRGMLESGDAVTISGTERKMRLLRLRDYRFFHLMRTKLTEWGSNHE